MSGPIEIEAERISRETGMGYIQALRHVRDREYLRNNHRRLPDNRFFERRDDLLEVVS